MLESKKRDITELCKQTVEFEHEKCANLEKYVRSLKDSLSAAESVRDATKIELGLTRSRLQ